MTNKSKKALKISLGIIIPTTVIFSSYFGAIACIRYNNYVKPNLPKKYETNEYKFNSKIYELNEQARKYFSMGQNIIESKKIMLINISFCLIEDLQIVKILIM